MSTPPDTTTSPTTAVVDAVVGLWQAIRDRHTDVPVAVCTIDTGHYRDGLIDEGHYTAGKRTRHDDDGTEYSVGEVTIIERALGKDATDLVDLVLHIAAHAIATVRGVKETARNGGYHNKRFFSIAQELGLDVEQGGNNGWCRTTATVETLALYQQQHDALAAALTAYGWVPADPGPGFQRLIARCKCTKPRIFHMSRTSFADGPVICGKCGANFTADRT